MRYWLERILHHGQMQPETPAIVLIDRAVTFGMLRAAVERCTRRLAALELPAAGPVGVLIENQSRHLAVSLALHRLGIAALSLEPGQISLPHLTLAAVLRDADGKGAIQTGVRLHEVGDDWFGEEPGGARPVLRGFAADQICRYALTSASTGQAKLLPYTADYFAGRLVYKFVYDVASSRRSVLVMPGLSSNLGYTSAVAALIAGRTVYFAESPVHAARMIDLYSIDFAFTSTEQLLGLARAARRSGARLSSLANVYTGGSSLTRVLLEQALAHVCRDIHCAYSASETGRLAVVSVADALAHPGLVGYPMPGVEFEIRDDHGEPRAAGEVGSIAVRNRELGDAAPDADAEGWVMLGDLGWLDAAGRLYVTGRSSDGRSAGAAISPAAEAEHLLELEWDVADAAAVEIDEAAVEGRPAIWFGIVGRGDASPEQLEAMLRQRGIDCRIRFFDLTVIPRGNNGKVRRGELRAMLQAAAVTIGQG